MLDEAPERPLGRVDAPVGEDPEEGLARAMQGLLEAVTQTSLAEAQKARRALFPPVETPDCPAYESAYRGRDVWGQTDLMADVAGFYRAHGLRVGAPIRERPDLAPDAD